MNRQSITLTSNAKVRNQIPQFAAAIKGFNVRIVLEKENSTDSSIELLLEGAGFPTNRTIINLAYDYFGSDLISFRDGH